MDPSNGLLQDAKILPKTITCPLKIDGWKMKFPSLGLALLNFRGGKPICFFGFRHVTEWRSCCIPPQMPADILQKHIATNMFSYMKWRNSPILAVRKTYVRESLPLKTAYKVQYLQIRYLNPLVTLYVLPER